MFKKDMNTFALPLGRSSELEDVFYQKLDADWAPLVKRLQETNDIANLDIKDYTLLTQFIAWQYVRSPFMVDEINRLKGEPHELRNFLERFKLQMQIQSAFLKKAVTFHWLRDESEFLTSDNPCFLYTNYPIQFMPLTKKLMIRWEDSEKLIFYKHEADKQLADEINQLIASDSRQYVVGSNRSFLNDAVENTKHHKGFLEKVERA